MWYKAKILGRLSMAQSIVVGEAGEIVWVPHDSSDQEAGIFITTPYTHTYV